MTREGQLDCVKLLASRGAGLDAKTEVKNIRNKYHAQKNYYCFDAKTEVEKKDFHEIIECC